MVCGDGFKFPSGPAFERCSGAQSRHGSKLSNTVNGPLVPVSYNGFQLSSVAQSVLDDLPTREQNLLLGAEPPALRREVYPAVTDGPAAALGKFDDAAFALQKQQDLGVCDRQRHVCPLAARRNLRADGADEDLQRRGLSASRP